MIIIREFLLNQIYYIFYSIFRFFLLYEEEVRGLSVTDIGKPARVAIKFSMW